MPILSRMVESRPAGALPEAVVDQRRTGREQRFHSPYVTPRRGGMEFSRVILPNFLAPAPAGDRNAVQVLQRAGVVERMHRLRHQFVPPTPAYVPSVREHFAVDLLRP